LGREAQEELAELGQRIDAYSRRTAQLIVEDPSGSMRMAVELPSSLAREAIETLNRLPEADEKQLTQMLAGGLGIGLEAYAGGAATRGLALGAKSLGLGDDVAVAASSSNAWNDFQRVNRGVYGTTTEAAGAYRRLRAERAQLASAFMSEHGVPEYKIASYLEGMNLGREVQLVRYPRGTILEQWQIPSAPQGSWYALPGSSPSRLGIADIGIDRATRRIEEKIAIRYILEEDAVFLQSTARRTKDTWSVGGRRIQTEGGDIQLFWPDQLRIRRLD
jgi:hypothetical protein